MHLLQQQIRSQLETLKDEKNRLFVAKLIPTIPPETILGIKTPVLRTFAKDFYKNPVSSDYLNITNHYYLEEKAVHAFLIEKCPAFGAFQIAGVADLRVKFSHDPHGR